MWGRLGVGTAALAMGAVLVTAGCSGEKAVTFQPADGPGTSGQPTATVTTTVAAPTGASTDAASGVSITRNGSTVCVRGPRGGVSCTSGHGVIVVDGVTVSDGVVVGGNGGVVSTVTPQPTKGTVRITGSVSWSGTGTGTCEGHGTTARTVVADLPGLGRLQVRNVGDGVAQVQLVASGTPYGLNYVGSGGPVSSTESRTVVRDARLGRTGNQVVLNADFDC